MAGVDVTERDEGKDYGPVRIMNPNSRRFSIVERPLPGAEKFEGKDIDWLVSFDVEKEEGATNKVPYKIKILQRRPNSTYVIKRGSRQPAELLDEEAVFEGDPAVGITTN